MTEDQATVVRIAALRKYADEELEQARRDSLNTQEHLLDARGALRRAMELENEQAAA